MATHLFKPASMGKTSSNSTGTSKHPQRDDLLARTTTLHPNDFVVPKFPREPITRNAWKFALSKETDIPLPKDVTTPRYYPLGQPPRAQYHTQIDTTLTPPIRHTKSLPKPCLNFPKPPKSNES